MLDVQGGGGAGIWDGGGEWGRGGEEVLVSSVNMGRRWVGGTQAGWAAGRLLTTALRL